jgi:colicin import membrane protein
LKRTLAKRASPRPPKKEPFYGWRYIERQDADGNAYTETVPLTLEDVLHPQEDDVIPENPVHESDRRYLSDLFHAREARLQDGLVLCDCLVNWGVEGVKNHSPDISVFDGVKVRPPEHIGTFHVRPSGGRCLMTIELVSPHTRRTDVKGKRKEYHQVQVPLYIMIDQKRKGGPRELIVFRYAPDKDKYVEERPERVLIKELGLWLGLKDNRVVCYDAETGELIGDFTAQVEARAAAEQARETAEQARQAAEQQARDQALARADAERRIQELEAELRRTRESK